jgi:hypothetical protein
VNLKTVSELAFEEFCGSNGLSVQRVVEGLEPTPDYVLTVNDMTIYLEVKQIDEDVNFSSTLQTRSPGTHVRAKINEARNQVRQACKNGFPAILLVYNNLDPLQRFGTEQHDFLAAMYGELTMIVSRTGKSTSGIFHGQKKALREDKNNSFSAVGWLHRNQDGVAVHLYENMYAKLPLNYESLPPAMQYNRVQSQGDENA